MSPIHKPAAQSRAVSDTARPTASSLNVSDDGQRPSWGWDGAGCDLIWVWREAEYFWR